MDTVLFTDHGIGLFVITAATALLLSVLGLATTYQMRSDIKEQFRVELPLEADAKPNEWASLRDKFNALMREDADSIEYRDEQFRRRFGELMYRTAHTRRRKSLAA